MAQRSQEQMYRQTGMTQPERDRVIWELRQRRHSYAKIAKAVGVSVGAVQASLRRTAERLAPDPVLDGDWDRDLR